MITPEIIADVKKKFFGKQITKEGTPKSWGTDDLDEHCYETLRRFSLDEKIQFLIEHGVIETESKVKNNNVTNAKKTTKKAVKKSAVKASATNTMYVIRLKDESQPTYWGDSCNDWLRNRQLSEASHYTKKEAITKIGEILHERGEVAVLIDITTPYTSPIPIGTVFVRDGNCHRLKAFLVSDVPTVKGEIYKLTSHDETLELTLQNLFDACINETFYVIWDPVRGVIEDDYEYLDMISVDLETRKID